MSIQRPECPIHWENIWNSTPSLWPGSNHTNGHRLQGWTGSRSLYSSSNCCGEKLGHLWDKGHSEVICQLEREYFYYFIKYFQYFSTPVHISFSSTLKSHIIKNKYAHTYMYTYYVCLLTLNINAYPFIYIHLLTQMVLFLFLRVPCTNDTHDR